MNFLKKLLLQSSFVVKKKQILIKNLKKERR